jgi:hypothetical protein
LHEVQIDFLSPYSARVLQEFNVPHPAKNRYITTSLAFLGGPFGMIGGAVALTLIAAISSMAAKVGIEVLAKAVVQKLIDCGRTKDSIIQEVNNFPMITEGLRAQLREYVRQA